MNQSLAKPLVGSLVIVTKNGGVLFEKVIGGLVQQSIWHQTEFIVVDSGSTDQTIDIAKKAGARVFEIPPNEFNHGLTRDLGISFATCEAVVLMVQDAVPADKYLLESMLNQFEDPEVAGVYAKQVPQLSADLLTKRNLNSWLTGRNEKESKKIQSLQWFEALAPMDKYLFCNFDNVCSAVRKSIWQNINFGPVAFGEDIDWAKRVLKNGHKIVYEPKAAVVHSHDRPLSYEYKRTYLCHRKLYKEFGLQLVPTVGGIGRAWIYSCLNDWRYVLGQSTPILSRVKLCLKIPPLNFLSAFAQYKAAKDEIRGIENQIKGV
jgi:rhamnosyltransferase